MQGGVKMVRGVHYKHSNNYMQGGVKTVKGVHYIMTLLWYYAKGCENSQGGS